MRRHRMLGLAAVAVLLAVPGSALAHGGGATHGHPVDQELPEKRLFEIEKATLGLEHAREHAAGRRLARRARKEPGRKPRLSSSGTVFSAAAASAGDGGVTRSAAGPASVVGRWQPPFSIPVMAINAAMLPTGKVLWFAYPQNPNPIAGGPDVANTAQGWLWDPATGHTKRVDPPLWRDPKDGQLKPANIWCAGTSFMNDGRVVVAGGNLDYRRAGPNKEFKGLEKVYTFDPFSETWTEQPDMEDGRWYPTQALLPDGRTVIFSGLDSSGRTDIYPTNKSIEVLTPSDESNLRGVGQLDRIPGDRGDAGMPPDGGLYPHAFWMPSGRLLVAGPDENDSWFLNSADTSKSLSGQWTSIWPQQSRQRLFGNGVQVPNEPGQAASTKFMQIGGWDDLSKLGNTQTTEVLDEKTLPGTTWQSTPSLNVPRSHANTVLLPDGSMVTVGGGVGKDPKLEQWGAVPEQKTVELWDPLTGKWTEGAAQQEYRTYHSTALLLPDGRVVSAGDDFNGGWDRDSAEIYEPPYLFKGPRPVISSAPGLAALGGTLNVATPDPSLVDHAALVAPGATTHANDMNQRYYALQTTRGSGEVSLTLPASANALVPGWYMLFLVSPDGVPSVASWVRVGPAGTPAPGQIVVEQQAPQDGSSFSFKGAPFVDFELAAGQTRATTVMAGTYEIAQGPSAHPLRSVVCDDGVLSPSSGDADQRLATVRVSPGEVVRCTFANATDGERGHDPPGPPPGDPPGGGSGNPPTGGPDPQRPDVEGPRSAKPTLDARRKTLQGRVTDASGVARVSVALGRRTGKDCRWWQAARRTLSGKPGRCNRPALIRATVPRSKTRTTWRLRLGRLPAPGRYIVVVRSWDVRGMARTQTFPLRVSRVRGSARKAR